MHVEWREQKGQGQEYVCMYGVLCMQDNTLGYSTGHSVRVCLPKYEVGYTLRNSSDALQTCLVQCSSFSG